MKYAEQLKNRVYEIAVNNPEGFTYNPQTRSSQLRGYMVATNDTQNCIGKKGLYRVMKYCSTHFGYCIGGWRNEDGQMQFDASRVFFDLTEAISSAIENGQRAIFNLYTGSAIVAKDYEKYIGSLANAA